MTAADKVDRLQPIGSDPLGIEMCSVYCEPLYVMDDFVNNITLR